MRSLGNTMTYEAFLELYGTLTYRNTGTSMLPMLKQGRDSFTVKKKTTQRCRKYDVILYRRPPDSYVLHRVITVREHDYVVLGDNCINKEYVKDSDIIGIMTEFTHNGKEYRVTDRQYQKYVRFWCKTANLRIFCKKVKLRAKRMIHAK